MADPIREEMPSFEDLDEAVVLWEHACLALDPSLKASRCEVVVEQTAAGDFSRPWKKQGGFAVVYRFLTPPDGQRRAVRFFHRPLPDEQRERYVRIGTCFAAEIADCTARSTFHDGGVAVRMGSSHRTFPLIDMDWVDGESLHAWVDARCKANDGLALERLMWSWATLMRRFRDLDIAHGDLSGTNIMVTPDERLVLIDYDGVYVPALQGLPEPPVAGVEDYQHPRGVGRTYGPRMDDFSALVIFTTLAALRLAPRLREHFGSTDDASGLLFRKEDFRATEQSALFSELRILIQTTQDAILETAVPALVDACHASSNVPLYDFPSADNLDALLRAADAAVGLGAASEQADATVLDWLREHGAARIASGGLTPDLRLRIGAVRRRHQARRLLRERWCAVERAVRDRDVAAANAALRRAVSARLAATASRAFGPTPEPLPFDPVEHSARIARCRAAITADDDTGILNAYRPQIAPWLHEHEQMRVALARTRMSPAEPVVGAVRG